MTLNDLLTFNYPFKSVMFIVDQTSSFKNKLILDKTPRNVLWEPSPQALSYFKGINLYTTIKNNEYILNTDTRNSYRICFVSTKRSQERVILGAFIKKKTVDGQLWLMEEILKLNIRLSNTNIQVPKGPYTAIYLNKENLLSFNDTNDAQAA